MSEQYLALYRKYRPQTFEDVCGRETIVRTLKNQITHGRTGHSYLFCGTRGTGKTTIAKIFARAVNCENPQDGNPCGICACCRATLADANLNVVEMDAASNNGVDDIRAVIEQVEYSPTQGRYRVFIIDEAHMLSTAAFNALLKTLEEPPSYAIFILCTTEPGKLPVTILSRCQRYDFGRMSVQTIAERVQTVCEKEGVQAEERAIRYIASAADGSMRDALSILDQCMAFNFGSEVLTYDKTLEILGAVDVRVFSGLYGCVHRGDVRGALEVLDRILSQGRELTQFVADYIGYLRNVMLLKASEDTASSLDVSADGLECMLADARMSELNEIIRYINVFSDLAGQIRYSGSRRTLTEAAIVRLCEPSMDVSRDLQSKVLSLENRIRALEDRIVLLQRDALSADPGSGGAEGPPGMAGAGNRESDPVPAQAPDSSGREEGRIQETGNAAGSKDGRNSGAASPAQRPAALSEDLQKIARSWDRLIAAIPAREHFLKICLQKARPSVTDDGELLVIFTGFLEADCFMGSESASNRKFFEEYLSAQVGRTIPVRYKYLDKARQNRDNYMDIRAAVRAGTINMKIEEEDF